MDFADEWLWLIFVVAGLLLAILELMVGVDTGLDMVIIGSAFIIGGLVTLPAESWIITVVVVSVIAAAYVLFGRKYVHRRMLVKEEKTNVDTLIGKTGIVLKSISDNTDGLVKVGYEEWRARSTEVLDEGVEVVVTGIEGVTLTVNKRNGGN